MMNRTAWWTLASAGAAPVLLVGGWTLAASRQPPVYNPIRDTISVLAARGATDRLIVTTALAGLGSCHMITGTGLRPARTGRLALVGGGLATLGVAAFPQPAHGNSVAHTIAAAVAFIALATWPVFAARRESQSLLLSPSASAAATMVMLGLVLWFVAETHGGHRGLAERFAAGAERLWPLVVVIVTIRHDDVSVQTSAG